MKLLLTDGAAYMVKCGKQLQIFYPNIVHVTCLAHALNLVAETIRSKYEEVNDLISNVKKIFLKPPLRVQTFRDTLPGCSLPPEPVLTRWGTWLQATIYYCDYSEVIKKVYCLLVDLTTTFYLIFQTVMQFDPTVAQAIAKSQHLFQLPKVKSNLSYIKAHFVILPSSITKLETIGLTLNESIGVIQRIYTSLENRQHCT